MVGPRWLPDLFGPPRMRIVPTSEQDELRRMHLPGPGDPTADRYKEWHHFVFVEPIRRVFGLINCSISGNPYSQTGVHGSLLSVFWRTGGKLQAGMESWPSGQLQLDRNGSTIAVGTAEVRVEPSAYILHGELEDPAFRFSLRFESTAPMLTLSVADPGSDYVRWVLSPQSVVRGQVVTPEWTAVTDGAIGYHDHNWGRFSWGSAFGWDGGLFVSPESASASQATVLALRLRYPGMSTPDLLFFGEGRDPLEQVRPDRASIRTAGRWEKPVARLPGAARLAFPQRHPLVADRMHLRVRTSDGPLSLDFQGEELQQIVAAEPGGCGYTELNELFGHAVVSHPSPTATSSEWYGFMETTRPLR